MSFSLDRIQREQARMGDDHLRLELIAYTPGVDTSLAGASFDYI